LFHKSTVGGRERPETEWPQLKTKKFEKPITVTGEGRQLDIGEGNSERKRNSNAMKRLRGSPVIGGLRRKTSLGETRKRKH